MKQKMRISELGQKVSDFALWLIIAVFALFLTFGSLNAQPIENNSTTLTEWRKNKNLKKYHKQNNKNFKCSACPDRGIKKLLPKKWR
jgi:hypothetical protein